jgi:MtN3 and saliva related transmembrane protein
MIIGLVAGILTTLAFLPQLTKTWKSKSSKDMSLVMLITVITGVFLCLIYGVLIQATPIIFANIVTLVFASSILALKIRYGRDP